MTEDGTKSAEVGAEKSDGRAEGHGMLFPVLIA